ncbi:hypothetical protein GYB22_02385 [bacterium]|nr:hypothetical protein [bacterium]
MNYNIISYTIFLSLAVILIIGVGRHLYKNGYYYLLELFKGDQNYATNVNKILYIGYALVNVGWVSISILSWPEILSVQSCFEQISYSMAILLTVLAILHINNLISLRLIAKRINRDTNNVIS